VTTIPTMLLAFDSSSAACTAALFDGSGACVARADEVIGRGHAERLVPMIAELMDGRSATHILVGVGPGSFTGIRVAIAAAHGLAIGWSAELSGMSSLALLAAAAGNDGDVAAAVIGGHGELFIQQFDGASLGPTSELRNSPAAEAARLTTAELVVGSGARQLTAARGWGEARELWPSASNALRLPSALRNLPAKPVYARAPDARMPKAA
jgi:tRNA threonylcarbamoyladenosine biosynthesis protein TsaB